MLIAESLEGICGSIMTTQSVAYAYIVDTVDRKDKTFRFSVIHSLFYIGTAVGNIFTGIVVRECGFLLSFVIFTVLFVFCIFIILTVIYEPKLTSEDISKSFNIKDTFIKAVMSFGVFLPRANQKKEIKEPMKFLEPIVTKKTIILLWLLLVAFVSDNLVMQGRNDVDVLFMITEPFCWYPMMIGYYQVRFTIKAYTISSLRISI
jgi:MFS family permease